MLKKLINFKNTKSDTFILREKWTKKGYDLINITALCEPKLGYNGCCNDFNEPEENFHHIQLHYRDETIANICGDRVEIIDDKQYIVHHEIFRGMAEGFIVYRKVKL